MTTQSDLEQEFFGKRPRSGLALQAWRLKVGFMRWGLPLLAFAVIALLVTVAVLGAMFLDIQDKIDQAELKRQDDAVELAETRGALCHLKASLGITLTGVCREESVLKFYDPDHAPPSRSALESAKTRLYICAWMRRTDPVTMNAVEQTTGSKCEDPPPTPLGNP